MNWKEIRCIRSSAAYIALLLSSFLLFGCAASDTFDSTRNSVDCNQAIPRITSGYGTEGIYMMDSSSVQNPSIKRSQVTVFLPEGTIDRRPVIFFSHGYGPNRWESYSDLIRHIVSRGYILVYSTYPALFASNDERYDALWKGFEAATEQLGHRMDLERVGFVGHSFGGGATPAMAYHGFVEQGWGRKGAFMMEMAPWYELQMSSIKWQQFPAHIIQVVQVYDQDTINDQRMAIDIYKSTRLKRKYFYQVRSATIGGCQLKADHSTPARSRVQRLKQYAVYRPLDAIAECAFEGTSQACNALQALDKAETQHVYQPLSLELDPVPAEPESFYRFPWSGRKNPQLDSPR